MSIQAIDSSGARLGVAALEPSQRRDLGELLRTAGYDTPRELDPAPDVMTHSAEAALDLILVDLGDLRGDRAAPLLARWADRPVIGVTHDATTAGRDHMARLGIADFLVWPIQPAELRMRVDNTLAAARLRRLLHDRSARLTEALRDHSAEADTVRETLSVLAAAADFHDDDSDQHAHRVGALAGVIARALALPDGFVAMLTDAAPLHDIGKVGISRRILLKPGSLTPAERMHMMQHVDIGGQILASAQSPVLVLAGEIARTHHERFDGSGYNSGLTGEQIPLSGRIVAVADVWDTLTHDRPYRRAWEPDRALTEIFEQSGSHFDPRVVEAFSSLDDAVLTPPARRVVPVA